MTVNGQLRLKDLVLESLNVFGTPQAIAPSEPKRGSGRISQYEVPQPREARFVKRVIVDETDNENENEVVIDATKRTPDPTFLAS